MKDKLLQIVNHYEIKSQLKYFQSEMFELNEAIIQYEMAKDDNKERIIKDGRPRWNIRTYITGIRPTSRVIVIICPLMNNSI